MESIAASIIKRAVEKDQKEQYTMALVLYQEGLKIFLDCLKDMKNPVQKKHFQTKACEYIDRAERVKALIEERKSTGKYREQMKIEDGSTGYGYASVFGRFLDGIVTEIHIEEPYIRTFHQCQNFLRFCELAVQRSQSLSKIKLITGVDLHDRSGQINRLEELKRSLTSKNITLNIQFSDTLHDRRIVLSNGWVIKIGRGLDYFKPPEGKFTLGFCDLELRQCHETMVDIFHQSHILSK